MKEKVVWNPESETIKKGKKCVTTIVSFLCNRQLDFSLISSERTRSVKKPLPLLKKTKQKR